MTITNETTGLQRRLDKAERQLNGISNLTITIAAALVGAAVAELIEHGKPAGFGWMSSIACGVTVFLVYIFLWRGLKR